MYIQTLDVVCWVKARFRPRNSLIFKLGSCIVCVYIGRIVVKTSLNYIILFSICLIPIHIIEQFLVCDTSFVSNEIFSTSQLKCKQQHTWNEPCFHNKWLPGPYIAQNLTSTIQILINNLKKLLKII